MAQSNSDITNTGAVVIQTTHDIMTIKNRLRQQVRKNGSQGYLNYTDVTGNPGWVMTEDASLGRIDIGELVYRVGSSSAPRGNILDGAPPVLSSLNGHFVPDGGEVTKEEKLRKLLQPISFIGIAVNGTDPMNNDMALRRSQCSVRVLGTATVQNTSGKNIAPGDLVCWNIPNDTHRRNGFTPAQARDGINHNKICLVLEKFNPKDARWDYTQTMSAMEAANEFMRYSVGTAINYAKPNGKLDLKLKN